LKIELAIYSSNKKIMHEQTIYQCIEFPAPLNAPLLMRMIGDRFIPMSHGREEENLQSWVVVAVGRVNTARLLSMCGNQTSCSVLLNRRSMLRALLCKIVIIIVQEVSFSKLGLQLGGSEEKTQLVSNKSPED
jgi:hypothetical protein